MKILTVLTIGALAGVIGSGAGPARAEEFRKCNGVYTTQPCSEVPKDLKPGVSKVPGRELTVSPVTVDRPPVRQAADSGQSGNSPSDTVVVTTGDGSYSGENLGDGRRAERKTEARKVEARKTEARKVEPRAAGVSAPAPARRANVGRRR